MQKNRPHSSKTSQVNSFPPLDCCSTSLERVVRMTGAFVRDVEEERAIAQQKRERLEQAVSGLEPRGRNQLRHAGKGCSGPVALLHNYTTYYRMVVCPFVVSLFIYF